MIFAEDKGIGIKGWLSGSKPKAVTEEKQPEKTVLDKHRVAVLPLANFSPDKNDEYFSEGLTEELITALSGVEGLRVIARTSVMHYKEAMKGVSEIGRELKVGTVLEGSVRKASNRIRVTVQLVDSSTEEHLWASNYDRQIEDIFEIQSDIANKVAEALKTKFLGLQKIQKPPESLEAYTLCLRARSLWNKRTKETNERAMLLFQKALTLDPTYARAYAGLETAGLLPKTGDSQRGRREFPRQKATSQKLLSLTMPSRSLTLPLASFSPAISNGIKQKRNCRRQSP